MPYNGSGVFTNVAGNPVVTGSTISSTVQNNTTADYATALSTAICKDGQTTITANLPMAGYRHTGVGNPTARTQYATVAGIQDATYNYLTSVAGTNTITATGALSLAAYATGQCFWFIPANTSTGAATININSIGAKSIFNAGAACIGGELVAGSPVTIVYDGTQFHILETAPRSKGVLQVATATDAGTTTTSTSLANVSSANVSITPRSATSSLLVECSFQGTEALVAATNTIASFRLYDVTNTALIGAEYSLSSLSSTEGQSTAAPVTLRAIVSNAVVTAREFQLRAKTNDGSAAAGATSQVWTITEIKT